ncbi:MFS transporter [Mangrovibacillus cuniculi]|uniref:MFS transporter n=1 Tax=Mangrovibacillus cuniculi TaxID=2593652 RepID=A0A7S8CA06_9BACI|nr:MFS transporter [Mangrovibacillus cuniculi]QPC46164.1 MFS transporter [Mangrovibacillus cuniculi]
MNPSRKSVKPATDYSSSSLERRGKALFFSLPILSWALYDFANTIFSSNINTIFFPFYVNEVVGSNAVMNNIAQSFISYANAFASLLLVIFSPLFGAAIDRTGRKKAFILPFTLIAVFCTFMMGIVGGLDNSTVVSGLPLTFLIVVVLFVIAKFFFHSSLVFYDAMMPDLGNAKELPLISGFGIAVGYVGTLVGLTVYLFVGEEGNHEAFIPTAVLFLLFSIPLFLFTPEKKKENITNVSFLGGYKEIVHTLKEMRKHQAIFLFMVAYFFLNDAIATAIAMMAVYAKAIVNFSSSAFVLLYLVSTIASIIGSFLFGFITKKVGAKKAVLFVGYILVVALTLAVFAVETWMFWIAGSLFGVSLGSLWVTTRTLIIQLSPEEKRGQFFGLFAFSGKVSAIIGPVVYGSITLLFSEYGTIASRMALGSLLLFAIVGILIQRKVNQI